MLFNIYELEEVEINSKGGIIDGWVLSRSLSYELIKQEFYKVVELASEKYLKNYNFLLNVFTYDTKRIIENDGFDETDYKEYDCVEEYSLKEYYERFKRWCECQTMYDLQEFCGSLKENNIVHDVLHDKVNHLKIDAEYIIVDKESKTLSYNFCEGGNTFTITFYEKYFPDTLEDYGVFDFDDFEIEMVWTFYCLW